LTLWSWTSCKKK